MFRKAKNLYQRIEWTNFTFLASAHVIAIGGTYVLARHGMIKWPTVVLAIAMMAATGLAITAGYHRLFAHKTYRGNRWVRLIMLLFGAAAFQNSARKWSSDHRRHHKYVDTDRDPYNIKEGFLFAHIGWVLLKYDKLVARYDDVPDLDADPLIAMQDRHYVSWAIAVGFGLPTLVASLWGDPIGGFIIAGWLRTVVNEHFTFAINSFAHMIGTQPYSDGDSSRDNWLLALVTYGEGYHNYHHRFPFDYRNGIRYYHWDPSKWLIAAFSRLGWARNLKVAPSLAILRARLLMDEKRVLQRAAKKARRGPLIDPERVVNARTRFEQAYAQFDRLKGEYAAMKAKRLGELSTQWTSMNGRIEEVKRELTVARAALEDAMRHWTELCSGYGVSPTTAAAV